VDRVIFGGEVDSLIPIRKARVMNSGKSPELKRGCSEQTIRAVCLQIWVLISFFVGKMQTARPSDALNFVLIRFVPKL
jgi:hypothetical protein